jgi:2-octaprenyl-6-methoxyphenol hydroxylase
LGSGIAVALVDPRPQARDGRLRTVALAAGPRRLIDQVGAWTALAPLAQPIRRMAIYDGRTRDAVRVEQLRFGGEDDEPLAKRSSSDSRRPWFAKK